MQTVVKYVRQGGARKTNKYGTKSGGGRKVGVLLAISTEDSNEVRIGYSLCNPNDEFDREVGIKIAESRAMKDKNYGPDVPETIIRNLPSFVDKCVKIFKDKQIKLGQITLIDENKNNQINEVFMNIFDKYSTPKSWMESQDPVLNKAASIDVSQEDLEKELERLRIAAQTVYNVP